MAECFERTGAKRRVKARYLPNLRLNKAGGAILHIEQPMEVMAVDRRGRVIVPNISFWSDFDYPTASDNRGRYVVVTQNATGAKVEKCGYFIASTFKIVIPAVYDHCTPFHDGQADTCTDCARYCTHKDCHDSVHVGGTGFTLNGHNKVLQTGPLPTLDSICGGPGLAKLKDRNTALECPARPQKF